MSLSIKAAALTAISALLMISPGCASTTSAGAGGPSEPSEQILNGDSFTVSVNHVEWRDFETGGVPFLYEDGRPVTAAAHCIVDVTTTREDIFPAWTYVFVDSNGHEVIELPYKSNYPSSFGHSKREASTHTHRVQPERSPFTCKVRAYK
nr:hypothetical protein GCM10017745_35870 [Saccharothrix mutabilis subsp. capreolus]